MNKINKVNKQSGFTLIEILVVIGIIAILATIVLIAINPARQFRQARDTQRTSNVNAILNAIGQSIADAKGTLPAGMPAAGTVADVPQALCEALVPTYIPALPTDPTSTFKGATLVKAGGANPGCEDLATGDAGYTVLLDTAANGGRINISAQAEIDQDGDGDVDVNDVIKVTR